MIEQYENKIPLPLLKEFEKEIKNYKATKAQEEEILKRLLDEYENAKISPGESIGIITAESFGEPTTQMVLNTFHFAGVAELNIALGLPRFIEILDARKTIATPMMEIYLKKDYRADDKAVRKIATSIKETLLNVAVEEFSINVSKLQIDITPSRKNMKDLGITDKHIMDRIQTTFKSYSVKQSPEGIITVKPAAEMALKDLYKVKEKLKTIYIKGVPGVSQVLPVKRGNEYVVLTAGSNLKDVLKVEEVDETRTISNNIFEIQDVLGIEAARNAIITELTRVIRDQGIDVDERHVMLVSDLMTSRGDIQGVTRSGVAAEKESVLARASFETPIKHLIRAAIVGEEDYLNSVIENVMLNQPVPLGTGLPGLLARMNYGVAPTDDKKSSKKPAKKADKEDTEE